MEIAIIVPGRLASARFPNKLLHSVAGVPLILHTARRIAEQAPGVPLYFAVDDERLAHPLRDAGFDAVMTRTDHVSGTDRIAEANARIGADRVINVQADEPLVTQRQIQLLRGLIETDGSDLATLAHRFTHPADFENPNQVKVVVSASGNALYFSRSPIPYAQDCQGKPPDTWLSSNPCYRHLGLYAYTADFLQAFTKLSPTYLESSERLEQLRALENGYRIAVGITDEPSIGVDSLEDARTLELLLRGSE